MDKKVEQQIRPVLEKTFKDYKAVNFSENTVKIITKFVEEFITNLDKKINLRKACQKSSSKEVELIGNIEQTIITEKINGPQVTIANIKDLVNQYRDDK